jgi:ketosteroid isomerase-like protein
VVTAFEHLRPDNIDALLALYAPDARFKDPFNDVRGHAGIRRIFTHMFETLQAPRFDVREAVTQGPQAFLTWDFQVRREGGQALTIHGATHLRFDAQGLVTEHRDYWDAAEELYAKLTVLGALMRWLQRRLQAR